MKERSDLICCSQGIISLMRVVLKTYDHAECMMSSLLTIPSYLAVIASALNLEKNGHFAMLSSGKFAVITSVSSGQYSLPLNMKDNGV